MFRSNASADDRQAAATSTVLAEESVSEADPNCFGRRNCVVASNTQKPHQPSVRSAADTTCDVSHDRRWCRTLTSTVSFDGYVRGDVSGRGQAGCHRGDDRRGNAGVDAPRDIASRPDARTARAAESIDKNAVPVGGHTEARREFDPRDRVRWNEDAGGFDLTASGQVDDNTVSGPGDCADVLRPHHRNRTGNTAQQTSDMLSVTAGGDDRDRSISELVPMAVRAGQHNVTPQLHDAWDGQQCVRHTARKEEARHKVVTGSADELET